MRLVRYVRQVLFVFLMIAVLFIISGCASKVICAPPNVLVGNSCCLDSDDNDLCDTWEEEDELEVVPVGEETAEVDEDTEADALEEFAETFTDTWNRKSYNALRNLFVDDYRMKFSQQEFNFLTRKIDAKLGIVSLSLVGIEDDVAEYKIVLTDETIRVSADIDEEDGEYRHESFYFFIDIDVDTACGDDGECFMTFATISGDRNHCDKAGDYEAECVGKFGVSDEITDKIDECMSIKEYYGRAECLERLAVNENDVEPCWQAGQDKQVFECMGQVAAARDDVDECPAFVSSKGYPGTRLQHTYCILGYVKETSDTDACAKIDRRSDVVLGAMQEGCYKMRFP